MFGYISIDTSALSKEERNRYQRVYCGLCQRLGQLYGSAGRMTLTYDMTFLTLLLGSLYRLEETTGASRCMRHPLQKQPFVLTEATQYAADINLILAYYQYLDDWKDEKKTRAQSKSQALAAYLPAIKARWPRQCQAIAERLQELSQMEKNNELNPDLPANCFGRLMGELFIWRDDEYAPALREMGAALGRFVYLLDAANDLKADIKNQRYNPLVAQMHLDMPAILTMMMGECTAAFDRLPIEQDLKILQNVLYAGVWMNYRKEAKKETEHHE